MSFGSTIKQLRKERNMTQDHLANLLCVTPQAISRWENNVAMPDISLLIPLANIFCVSTDTLLEVNVQKNEEHIKEFVLNAPFFNETYGNTLTDKLDLYREKVRQFPESAELKESLIIILTMLETREGAFPDPAIHREMAMLTEDIIEAGGGSMGISHHQSQLVHFLKKLNNAERAEKVTSDSVKMEACREMLLPSSLTGREQIDARRDLIFKCTDAIINTVYDLYAENAADLTEEEWNSLASVENVVATVYGQNFNDHFVLVRGLYKGVQGALKRGKIEEAVQRLQVIVERLKLQEAESAHINPLILEEQVDRLYLSHLTIFSISMEAMWLVENITKDFSYEGAPAFKKEYPQFDEVCKELSRMMDSDGGQMEKDANNILIRMWRKAHPDADQE